MSDYSIMRQLGLSKIAVTCYQDLFESGGSDAASMAERIGHSRTGLYRYLTDLEAKGFVKSVKTEPYVTYYYAELLNKALVNYAKYQRLLVRQLLEEQEAEMARRSGKSGVAS
ncbi:MAG TPA: helix-turn-helix domain-containing protein, partial [Candidatus Saccharimonadales bacterium]|nr:helix-turn-helix domain-containing protein [Candidatus Saccharimonadales bacterium]